MKTRALFAKIASLSLLGLSLICQVAWAQGQGGNAPAHVPGRILVKFKDGVGDGQARGLLAGRGALSTNVIPQLGIHIVQLPPNANEQAEANAFKGLAEVEFADVDRLTAPSSITPNDPYFGSDWHFWKLSASDAWSVTTGNSSNIIAIIDTGVDGTHVDLSAKMVAGWNVVDGNSNTADTHDHGTQSAGVAAASSNNGLGLPGVCWGCMIMPVRVTDQLAGYATSSDVANGITWAADHGARIASVGYALTDDATASAAAQYFFNKGGVVVMPAGNGGTVDSNPDNPYVVTVGSTDLNDVIYSWSNTGNSVDLVAPGCAVYTTEPGNAYATECGTSASAAAVAGVVGLIRSVNAGLTPVQITGILRQSVDDLGTAGWDPTYGSGRINALKAVNNANGGGQSLTPTTTALTSSLNPSISGQSVTFTATVSPSAATGTVTFKDGTTTIGSGTLSSGRATLSTASLTAGASHSITASYGGNTSYSSSVSAILSQTVNNSTSKTNTTTSLASSLNPSISGQTVTFTATVSASTATGTVTFFDGSTSVGGGTLSSGRATLSTASLTAGIIHSITASYGGDTSYNGSVSAILSQTVNNSTSKTNTTTSLASSLNPSLSGQTVTFTATVSPSTATGTVTFFDGSTSLGGGTLSSGRATLSTASLTAGVTHSITASYGGDTSYNGSVSAIILQSVNTSKGHKVHP